MVTEPFLPQAQASHSGRQKWGQHGGEVPYSKQQRQTKPDMQGVRYER